MLKSNVTISIVKIVSCQNRLDFHPWIKGIPTSSAKEVADPAALSFYRSPRYPVIQEPSLLTRGDQKGQEADRPHGHFSRWTKIQLKKYFIKLLLFLISSGEYQLVWQQGCSEVNMERSKADALGCSTWTLWVSGMLPGGARPPGKLPWEKRGVPAFPSPLGHCTKWAVFFHHLVAVRREEGKGCHTGILCFACGRELTLIICLINSETSFLWCSRQLLGEHLPRLRRTLLLWAWPPFALVITAGNVVVVSKAACK